MTTNGTGLNTGGQNPGSVIILQKRFGVGPDVVTSSAWGEWFGSMRCSAFELPDGCSCDMGPPSSTKILVENLCVCSIGAFIVGATGRSYLRSLLHLLFIMLSYFSTSSMVLTVMRVLPIIAMACRPYLCQVGRTIADSSIPMVGRLRCVGSTTLEVSSSKGVRT
ncbi:hypothetical protein B296_00052287 [Ensete ventricosum]|uniref:Uncharacterized protein n=1 Tax=Ensete ventricosum TaxID=4639 RepID=A0A426YCY7_ENSVE|nr:hypothetical protein B296_00052287 [Ensete ventricosum]